MNITLVSFLGTNEYLNCRYSLDGMTSSLKPFVQEALIELLSCSRNTINRVLILCTDNAKKSNWYNSERYNGIGLKGRLNGIEPKLNVECIDIPEGQSETELWEIFSILYDKIDQDENIYLDITHSYRSLPMLVIPFINYTRLLKNIQVSGIVYGAFESIGTRKEIESIPDDERIAPIFNLIAFDELLQWSNGINSFTRFGNAELLKTLIKEKSLPVLKTSKGEELKYQKLEKVGTGLDKACKMITSVRGNKINKGKDFIYLNENIEELIMTKSILPPITPLLEILKAKISVFKRNNINNSFHAVKWCIEHGLIQQGITLLQENMISYILDKAELEITERNNRELVSMLMSSQHYKKQIPKEDIDKINKINSFPSFREYSKIYEGLRDHRNDINHAGFRNDPISSEMVFEDKLKESYTALNKLIENGGF